MSLDFEFGRKGRPSTRDWWAALPTWLKLVYVFVSTPAWVFGVSCILSGQSKSAGALASFGIFAATVVLFLIFDRRRSA